MRAMTLVGLFLALVLSLPQAMAQDIAFNNLSEKDVEDIVSDFTGAFTHTSFSGANTMGSIFGFEIGLIGGIANVDRIKKIAKRSDANSDVSAVPFGGLLGRITVPFGFTVEALVVPEVGGDEFKFSNKSLALMWTPTETVLSFLPLSIAIKGHYTKTDLKFKIPDAVVTGVDVDASFDNTIMGAQLLISKNLLIVEPYAGVGFVSGDGSLSYSGSGSIFNGGVTPTNTAKKKVDGTQFLVGANLKLLILNIGAEYSQQIDVQRYGLKISAGF